MIQCFVSKDNEALVTESHSPKVAYTCKSDIKESLRALHSHENILEIILITKGKGRFIIDGHNYNIEKGNVIIINPGIVHEEISDANYPLAHCCVAMRDVSLPKLPFGDLIPPDRSPIYVPSDERFILFKELAYNIYDQVYYNKKFSEYIVNTLANSLVCLLLQDMGDGSPQQIETDMLIERAKSYVEANFKEDISLADISEALNISTYYLSRKFKEHAGYSLNQYINHLRIGEAQNLLIHTDYPIIKVAEIVGFNNQSYFNLIFNKTTGLQPSKFRELSTKKK